MPEHKEATKQARVKVSPRSGVAPPVERQFGKENGNPRHNGAWKKEDTLRWKWEQALKMSDEELKAIIKDKKSERVMKMTAEALLSQSMKPTEKIEVLNKLATQVYGQPKQSIETVDLTPPKPLSPRKAKK